MQIKAFSFEETAETESTEDVAAILKFADENVPEKETKKELKKSLRRLLTILVYLKNSLKLEH